MTTFRSCHLIVIRIFVDDCRGVHDLTDADFLLGRYFYSIFKCFSSTNADIFPHHYAHFGKTLNISTANDCTLTVYGISTDIIMVELCNTVISSTRTPMMKY